MMPVLKNKKQSRHHFNKVTTISLCIAKKKEKRNKQKEIGQQKCI